MGKFKACVLAAAGLFCFTAAAVAAEPLTLADAVELARQNNYLIRETAARSQAAVEQYRASRADLFAKAAAGYRYARLKETPFMYFTRTTVSPDPRVTPFYVVSGSERIQAPTGPKDNFHWEASLTQPLFTGFALTTRVQMAQLGIEIGEVETQQAVADVIKQVKSSFFDVLLARQFLETARAAEGTLDAHVNDASRFFEQGLIPYNDLLQSQVALADAVQRRTRAEADARMAVAVLNTVMGLDLEAGTLVATVDEAPAHPPSLATLIPIAEVHRPELRYLELSLAKIDAAARLAGSAYYPTVALVGRYEQDGDNFRATDNDFRNSYNTTVAVQAEWTFFEWGKTRADVARIKRERDALAAKAAGVRDSIRLEVKNAQLSLAVALANIQTARSALTQADENLRITRLRYQQQVAPSTEVLDANAAQTQADNNFHAARYSALKAEAELERAVGGRLWIEDRKVPQ